MDSERGLRGAGEDLRFSTLVVNDRRLGDCHEMDQMVSKELQLSENFLGHLRNWDEIGISGGWSVGLMVKGLVQLTMFPVGLRL
jgi:hypothetical protein